MAPARAPAARRGGDPRQRLDDACLRARVHAELRQFDEAERWLERGRALAPDEAWLWVETSAVLEREDRVEEALEAARRALALRPSYRPAVQATASLLELTGRPEEALELLTSACEVLESGYLLASRADLLGELGRHEEARAAWEGVGALLPLLEPDGLRWLADRRSEAAYLCGDLEAAERLAKGGSPRGQRLGERIAAARAAGASGPARRVLPVPFVRQDHVTCAPASLTMVARAWAEDCDHAEVAGELCFDGTPAQDQRAWAERRGWFVRELTLTWDAAVALLDRGVPLTVSTVEPTSAHLQVVAGYDLHRRLLLLRDPSTPRLREVDAEAFLARYSSSGPHARALGPAAEAGRLDGVALPDERLWELRHELHRALDQHDRGRAQAARDALAAASPDHWLALDLELDLAYYDDAPERIEAGYARLAARFPGEQRFLLARLPSLAQLAPRQARLDLLEPAARRDDVHPAVLRALAIELALDAREAPRAERLLRRALRRQPRAAATVIELANLLWDGRRFEDGYALYRLASALEPTRERYVRAAFNAARSIGDPEELLATLRDRVRRWGHLSSAPIRTLHDALDDLDRHEDAFAALEAELARRPEDGPLALYAAEAYARYGRLARAEELLVAARDRAPRTGVLRAEATIAWSAAEVERALELWREVHRTEPWAVDAAEAVADLLALTEGEAAAAAHLTAAARAVPDGRAMRHLEVRWLARDDDPSRAIAALQEWLARQPEDAWAHRELALQLARGGRFEEAKASAERGAALDPEAFGAWLVRGRVLARAGERAAAAEAYREALRREVDSGAALGGLLDCAADEAEERAALEFAAEQLSAQRFRCDGVLAFGREASDRFGPAAYVDVLRRLHAERPDAWATWSALVDALGELGELDEALAAAEEACARFPLVSELWFDLGYVRRLRGDGPEEVRAFERARALEPRSRRFALALAGTHRRQGAFEAALGVVEEALRHSPRDPGLHVERACLLWREDQRREAVEALERALRFSPTHERAWRLLRDWDEALGAERALALARELTERRPANAALWLSLARVAPTLEERLAALDRAEALAPRDTDIHDLRATLLAEEGRFDEALAACAPAAFGEERPYLLEGRAAWVLAERGDRAGAITRMRAVVERSPSYFWGWTRLSNWYRDAEAGPEHLEAARAMVALAPQDPVARTHLGSALVMTGARAEGKAEWRRAVELDPAYAFAADRLLDLQLEDGELEAAAATAAVLEQQRPTDPETWERAVEVATRRGDREAALRAFERLCERPRDPDGALRRAARRLAGAGWRFAARRRISAAFEREGTSPTNPWVAAVWVEGQARVCAWARIEERLAPLWGRGEVGEIAAEAYLDALAEQCAAKPLERFVAAEAERLRPRPQLWGSVGYALARCARHTEVVAWYGRYEEREGVAPWMLLHLCWSLLVLERHAEALAAAQRGLSLEPRARGRAIACLAARAAALHALAGDREAATGALARAEPEADLSDRDRFLRHLARAWVELAAGGLAAARAALRAAREEVPRWREDVILRRHHALTVRHVAAAAGWVGLVWRLALGLLLLLAAARAGRKG